MCFNWPAQLGRAKVASDLFFAGYSGLLHQLQLASHDLATIEKVTKKHDSKFQIELKDDHWG